VDDPAFTTKLQAVAAELAAVDGVASVIDYASANAAHPEQAQALVSADRHTTILPVTFDGRFEDVREHTAAFEAAVEAQADGGFEVLTVGDLSANETFSSVSESDLQRGELIAIPIALLILVLGLRALVAAVLPLILAGAAIVVALGIAGLLTHGMTLSTFIVNMLTMIGLAVGIDYALFIVDRYREERRRGRAKLDAITVAGDTANKSVLFSGITVILSLFGILLLPTTIFLSLGLGAIIVTATAVLAVLTLVPAVLSLLGDRIEWPRRFSATPQPRENHGSGFWVRVTDRVMARPWVSLLLSGAFLLALCAPAVGLENGLVGSGAEGLPASTDTRQAYDLIATEFSPGRVSPVRIVVDGARTPEVEAGIDRLIGALATDPTFAPAGAITWNAANDLAEIQVPLAIGPTSDAAMDAMERLREEHLPAAFAGTGAETATGGHTALNYDFIAATEFWRPYSFAVVLGLSFLLLLLVFRSIVVPIKAIIMNLLSVGAAYGLLVIVFKHGYGAGLLGFTKLPAIEAWIPLFLFSVLFGLSMDYHVFLLSRIRENWQRSGDNRASVAAGLQATGKIITGAALIMVVVFSGFATGQMTMFQQMGFGLAVAILIDATIVRSILVPASMALLGNRNWYLPSWLEWLPNLWIEGRPEEPQLPADVAPAPVMPMGGMGED
jgi:RND superfamily putative drug exporter